MAGQENDGRVMKRIWGANGYTTNSFLNSSEQTPTYFARSTAAVVSWPKDNSRVWPSGSLRAAR